MRGVHQALLGIAALIALVATGQASVAYAHALLERSEPTPGSVAAADKTPTQVTLWFSEPVSVAFNSITVLDADNRRVDNLDARVSARDPTRVDVSLNATAQGAYVVRWSATSADNHVVRGSYWYAVGFATAPPPGALAFSDAPSVPPLEVAGRALVLIGVLGLTGAALFRIFFGWLTPERVVLLVLGTALGIGQLAWAAAQSESIAGLKLPQALSGEVLNIVLLKSGYAALWWSRSVVGALLLGLLMRAKTRWPSAAAGVLLVLSVSLGSHAAAARLAPMLAVSVDVVHLLAASIWLGGLLQVVCLLPELQRTMPLRALVPRLSTVALTSVAVLLVTGLFSAWEQIASLEALVATPYGQSLLLKLALVLCLLAPAAMNLLYVRPRAGSKVARVFHRLVMTEVLIGGFVLVAVGTLSALPPPAAVSLPAAVESTRQIGDLRITLAVDPNWVGVSRFRVTLADQRGQPPPDVQQVVYTFAMQGMNMGRTTVFASPHAPGVYESDGFYVGMPGISQVGVSVSRANAADAATVFLIDVPDLNHNQFDGLRASLGVGPIGVLGLCLALIAGLAAAAWRRGAAHPGAIAATAIGLAAAGVAAFVVDSSGAVNAATASITMPSGVADHTRGQVVYAEHCGVCHGETGIGDGPAGASLVPPPSDLTLHARWHPDEQLYWFISNGVAGTAMPAWGDQLTPLERRDVIDYLHELANAPTATPLVGPAPAATPQTAQVAPTQVRQAVAAATRGLSSATPAGAPATATQVIGAAPTSAQAAAPAQAQAQAAPTPSPASALSGRLVFGPDNDGNLWVWHFPAEKPEKLTTFGPGEYSSFPVWSPDGSQVAFSYYKLPRTGSIPIPDGTDLYIASGDGTEPHVLATHDRRGVALQFPAWAPDGKSIFVAYRDLGGVEAHIERVDVESGQRTQIIGNAGYPAISPDGTRIAYGTSPAAGPQQGGTTLMWSSVDGGDAHVILGPQVFLKFYGLRISPDGKRLLFAAIGAGNNFQQPQAGVLNVLGAITSALAPPVAYADGEIYDLWTIGLDGRDLQRVTQLAEDLPISTWAPDGRQIAFLGGGSASLAQSGLAVLNPDGSQLRRLTGVPGHRGIDWTPTP